MKLVIDEKLKHRLVGLAVILSLGAIFLPTLLKKSSQRLENNFSVNVQLPPKPKAPKVAMTDEKEMFKTIKIAHIKIPPTPAQKNNSEANKKDYIHSIAVNPKINQEQSNDSAPKTPPDPNILAKPIELALSNAAKNVVKKHQTEVQNTHVQTSMKKNASSPKNSLVAKIDRPSSNGKEMYAVQLASFSKLTNAQALVNRLHSKGYKANYVKSASKQGPIYKVYVGHSFIKNDVIKLKTQLALAVQLDGFIVNTGVS